MQHEGKLHFLALFDHFKREKLFYDGNFSYDTFTAIFSCTENQVHSGSGTLTVEISNVPGYRATIRLRLPNQFTGDIGDFNYGIRCKSADAHGSVKFGCDRIRKYFNPLKLEIAFCGVGPKRHQSPVRSKENFPTFMINLNVKNHIGEKRTIVDRKIMDQRFTRW